MSKISQAWNQLNPGLKSILRTVGQVALLTGTAFVCYKVGKKVGANNVTAEDAANARFEAKTHGYTEGLAAAKADVWNDGFLHGSNVIPFGRDMELAHIRSKAFTSLRSGESPAQAGSLNEFERWSQPPVEVDVTVH